MTTPQETNTIATQTEETSNLGQGRQPLAEKKHYNPLPEIDLENPPDCLKQLYRAFGKNFIEEATRNDPQSRNLFQIIEEKNWDALKHFSRYWHSLKRDLSTTLTGCILYDGKLYIPTQLRKLVMNSIHPPGTIRNDAPRKPHMVPKNPKRNSYFDTKLPAVHQNR